MSKKSTLKLGFAIIVLSLSLSLNFIFSDNSDYSNFIFTNVEALASTENPNFKPDCIKDGYICTGLDSEGSFGDHPGLTINWE